MPLRRCDNHLFITLAREDVAVQEMVVEEAAFLLLGSLVLVDEPAAGGDANGVAVDGQDLQGELVDGQVLEKGVPQGADRFRHIPVPAGFGGEEVAQLDGVRRLARQLRGLSLQESQEPIRFPVDDGVLPHLAGEHPPQDEVQRIRLVLERRHIRPPRRIRIGEQFIDVIGVIRAARPEQEARSVDDVHKRKVCTSLYGGGLLFFHYHGLFRQKRLYHN